MSFVCSECARSYDAPGFCTEDGASLTDSSVDPLLGQQIGSHLLARRIGAGGMGTVYLGVHPQIGSRVAVKVLAYDGAQQPVVVERFFAEARAVNVVRHEGIVSVIDLGRLADGRPYIVMEFLDGAPLSEVLERYRPVPLGGFINLMLQVLEALAAAHAQGITHRDIKPDNVFVTAAGRAKVLDFGIAKLRPDLSAMNEATRTGALMGTPYYMSPEQAQGRPVDQRADLYAVGILLYEGITGRRPFEASALYEILRLHIEAAPVPPSTYRAELPPACETAVLRALEKQPERRFASAEEFAETLRRGAQFVPADSFTTLVGQRSEASVRRPVVPSPAPLLPTAPGVTASLAHARSTEPRSRLPIWLALGGASAALALVALVAAGLAVWWSGGPGVERPAGSTAERPSGKSVGAGPSRVSDLSRVQVVDHIPAARKAARRHFSDAELMQITVNDPARDGTVDVTDEGSVVYTFKSETEASKLGSFAPVGRCVVWVTLGEDGLNASVPPVGSCIAGTVAPPRCSVKLVLDKVLAAGQRPDDVVLTFGATGWTVVVGEGMPKMVSDDC